MPHDLIMESRVGHPEAASRSSEAAEALPREPSPSVEWASSAPRPVSSVAPFVVPSGVRRM